VSTTGLIVMVPLLINSHSAAATGMSSTPIAKIELDDMEE